MAAVLLVGCGDGDGYPNGWQPAVVAPDGQCPDITGTFRIDDPVTYQALAGGRFYEEHPRAWTVMSVAGNPQQGLQITLYEANTGAPGTMPIRLNQGSDYQCQDGWLQLPWPGSIRMDADTYDPNDTRLMDKSLGYAKNRAGELVIRTDTARWHGFPVWCGDGCKYVPIPFTRTVYHAWSRWSSVPIPVYKPALPATGAQADAGINDAPVDDSPAGRVAGLLRELAPDGVRVIAVRPDGERWIGLFQGHPDNLIVMHEALMRSAAVADLIVHPVQDRNGPDRTIELSFVATELQAERVARATREQAQAVAPREAEDDRVAKLFAATLPTGAFLMDFQRMANGYQARVQCPDDAMVYAVMVNANLSGHFSQVGISSRARDQDGGTTAEIALGLK